MADTENSEQRVYAVARAVVDRGEEIWVSPAQFIEFQNSGKFTEAEMKCFVMVRSWPSENEVPE